MYNKLKHDSSSKIKEFDLINIIRAVKKIKRLVSIINNNWEIIDVFSNLDVNFFKLILISINN